MWEKNDDNDKGKITVEKAGRKGGESVADRYVREFYQDIGSKSGKSVVDKYEPEYMAKIGLKGGESSHSDRGLEENDEKTRERIAKEGGKTSHSSGRKKEIKIYKIKNTLPKIIYNLFNFLFKK